jgi:hypothetical protein
VALAYDGDDYRESWGSGNEHAVGAAEAQMCELAGTDCQTSHTSSGEAELQELEQLVQASLTCWDADSAVDSSS